MDELQSCSSPSVPQHPVSSLPFALLLLFTLPGIFVEGATEIAVTNQEQLVSFMQQGLAQRSIAGTRGPQSYPLASASLTID